MRKTRPMKNLNQFLNSFLKTGRQCPGTEPIEAERGRTFWGLEVWGSTRTTEDAWPGKQGAVGTVDVVEIATEGGIFQVHAGEYAAWMSQGREPEWAWWKHSQDKAWSLTPRTAGEVATLKEQVA